MKLADISSLETADRVEIFKHLAVSELDGVNEEILSHISAEKFHAFHEFCEQVFQEKDKIEDVSCSVENGELVFNIDYKK